LVLRLLAMNKSAAIAAPQAAAAAYAFAAVWDRVRFGVLPPSAASDILCNQAATLAASLSARPELWHTFWKQLEVRIDRPLDAVYDAFALGWTAKWPSKD